MGPAPLVLLPPPARKRALVGSLDTVDWLVREFIAEKLSNDDWEGERWLMSAFMVFARQKMIEMAIAEEAKNGTTNDKD